MNKRGIIEERVILRPYELVMVAFIFFVMVYFATSVIQGVEVKQRKAVIDLGLGANIVGSSPGNLEIYYDKGNIDYFVKGNSVVARYELSDKFYDYFVNEELIIEESEDKVVLRRKNE